MGATAIEDKLQDEVGESIKLIRNTGIKVWVLTGDKIETAINIGFSCRLLEEQMRRLVVEGVSEESVGECLQEGLEVQERGSAHQTYALIVSGDALIHITKSADLSRRMLSLAARSESVLACRVSPKQKMEVVNLVRHHYPAINTLAIGDGANDVNMITAAHVGIGIRGVEGLQAARASDYSIGEFKFIAKLILYYGRESYRKNTNLIIYNFYKNMLYVLPQFWLAFFNQFSG